MSIYSFVALAIVFGAAGCGSDSVGLIDTDAALGEVVAAGGRDYTMPVPAPSELKKQPKAASKTTLKRAIAARKSG